MFSIENLEVSSKEHFISFFIFICFGSEYGRPTYVKVPVLHLTVIKLFQYFLQSSNFNFIKALRAVKQLLQVIK